MPDEISNNFPNAEGLPADFKHRQPLSDEELQGIRKKLRPEGQMPALIEMPPPGQDLMPFLRQQLQALGYPQTHFVRRVVSKDRLQKTIMTGTDRDQRSKFDHKEGDDGERLAMIENGLNPLADGEVITYVADLNLDNGRSWIRPKDPSFSILVYAPDAIQYIQPSSNRTGMYANGFAMFKDSRLIQPSLLAVLSPISRAKIFSQGQDEGSFKKHSTL